MKNATDKANVASLKDQRDALVKKLIDEKKRSADKERELAERERKLKIREKKLGESIAAAEAKERAVSARYLAKLKELKFFSDRVERLVSSKESVVEKSRLTDLFKGFLDNLSPDADVEGVAKKVMDSLGKETTEEEQFFDLDEAINPKGELDLKKLCEELGVYQG